MRVTILGVRETESKGRPAYTYTGTKEFTAYDQEHGKCEGVNVVSEFSYTDYNLHPGDVVEFDYEPGFQGRATLVDVRPVKLAGESDVVGPQKKPEAK